MSKKPAPPAAMAQVYGAIAGLLETFCATHLDADGLDLALAIALALSRKRPSPLLRGKPQVWAAGIVHAMATVNFLFDRTRKPYIAPAAIHEYFDVAESTVSNKSKSIRESLKMSRHDFHWLLPRRIERNPMVWIVTVNGLLVDARSLPREAQEIAFAKGLIPYVPGDGQTRR